MSSQMWLFAGLRGTYFVATSDIFHSIYVASGDSFCCNYWKEPVEGGTRGITPKTCSPSGEVLRSFVESYFRPTSRAGTLQLDAGPNPHPVA
jgi:hypothetical protein